MVSLGPLAMCEPRELVKVKVQDATEWAIVGARDPGYFPLIFLTGDNAPFVINVEPNQGDDFETYPVAKYGTKYYRFVHDPNGPSQIGDGDLSKAAGTHLLTENGDWYLVVNQYRKAGLRWFDLASGKVRGEPGSHRIAFGNWKLFVDGLKPTPSETELLSHSAKSAS
jgi:hypothetical protein